MAFLRRILRVLATPHNPRNVALFFLHWLMGSTLVVAFYRALILPRVVRRVKACGRVRVVFLPMNCAMWRYGEVYRRMKADSRFDPVIVTAPRIIQPKNSFVREQRELTTYFQSHGVQVVVGFDERQDRWINLSTLKPDVVFYTQPYDGLLPKELEYWHNLRSLVCYAPYSFQFNKVGWNWDNALQNYAWRHYVSLPHHVELCRSFSRVQACNAVSVGYFFEEEYHAALAERILLEKVWRGDRRKRVIWAPHHSIVTGAEFKTSAFLEVYAEMLRLRDKYHEKVVIAFKPHPMLRNNLYQYWGRDKTEAYYADWDNAENSFLDEGSFIPLFAGSDAMIHCSGSFIVDYIYTGKPVQYVYCKDRNAPDFGEIGDASLRAHYPAHEIADVEKFIEDVVLNGNDPMRKQREDVYGRYLKSPNGKTFSENVIEDILVGLGRKSST